MYNLIDSNSVLSYSPLPRLCQKHSLLYCETPVRRSSGRPDGLESAMWQAFLLPCALVQATANPVIVKDSVRTLPTNVICKVFRRVIASMSSTGGAALNTDTSKYTVVALSNRFSPVLGVGSSRILKYRLFKAKD